MSALKQTLYGYWPNNNNNEQCRRGDMKINCSVRSVEKRELKKKKKKDLCRQKIDDQSEALKF